MITEKIEEKSVLLWQEWADDNPPEPAILLQKYSDCITITQEGRQVNVCLHELAAFIKALRTL